MSFAIWRGKWQVFAAGASGFWNDLRLTPNWWQLRHAKNRNQLQCSRRFKWQNMDYGNFEAQKYDLWPGVRKTFDRAFIYEISDEYNFNLVRDGDFDDADAAYFELTAECRRRGRDKLRRRARAVAPQDDLIVGDKLYHVVQKSRRREPQAAQRKVGFSRS